MANHRHAIPHRDNHDSCEGRITSSKDLTSLMRNDDEPEAKRKIGNSLEESGLSNQTNEI